MPVLTQDKYGIANWCKEDKNMYCLKTIVAEALLSAATEIPPFGPGFSSETVAQADTMEIWGSSFTDSGEDFVEYRLLKNGHVMQMQRFPGY